MKLATRSPQPTVQERTMRLDDGTRIFYRAWLPARPARRAVVCFHRGHEHSGRLADVVEALGFEDAAVFAWDARGHGLSEGERGFAPSFGRMVRDVDEFMHHVAATHGIAPEDTIVLAHSVGAVAVTTWVHDYAPRIRGLVLATPAFRVKLYVPFAIPGLKLLDRLRPGRARVKSYVKSRMLTHDAEQARRYDADPLIEKGIAVHILLQMRAAADRIVADAGAIRVPTLLLTGGADWVVDTRIQQRFFDRLGATRKRQRVFPGLYHDILHEKEREPVLAEIRRFVQDSFEDAPARRPLLDADRYGYTSEEHGRLTRPPRFRLPFAIQRAALHTVGRLSRGMRLGLQSGFDSGRTLDYVYENRPRGALGVGRLIDRNYLESIGWRGIRQRKVHLEELLAAAMQAAATEHGRVRVLDVATGAGRYVLDAIAAHPELAVTAILRDNVRENLVTGAAHADRMGLRGIRYEIGDAFDEEQIARTDANVVIVSGLYELFVANDPVRTSLRGIARALRKTGGHLVYTGQPWHPQLEMIARVLPNRNGEAWAMRRRTQEEMDDLVREAGFEKTAQRIDEHGIFTVSLARIERA